MCLIYFCFFHRYGIPYADIMPIGFYNDFVGVADDECRHFLMLEQRLKDLGSYYGAMPAHDGCVFV